MSNKGAVYLGEMCQRLSSELQAMGYGLSHMAQQAGGYGAQTTNPLEYSNVAGQAARLRSQTSHTLKCVETLMQTAEEMASDCPATRPTPIE